MLTEKKSMEKNTIRKKKRTISSSKIDCWIYLYRMPYRIYSLCSHTEKMIWIAFLLQMRKRLSKINLTFNPVKPGQKQNIYNRFLSREFKFSKIGLIAKQGKRAQLALLLVLTEWEMGRIQPGSRFIKEECG